MADRHRIRANASGLLAVIATVLLGASGALAQGAVFQSGPIVPGHPVVWGGNGSVRDGGAVFPLLNIPQTWTGLQTFSAGAVVGGTLGAQFQSLVPSTFSSTVGITGNTTVGGNRRCDSDLHQLALLRAYHREMDTGPHHRADRNMEHPRMSVRLPDGPGEGDDPIHRRGRALPRSTAS